VNGYVAGHRRGGGRADAAGDAGPLALARGFGVEVTDEVLDPQKMVDGIDFASNVTVEGQGGDGEQMMLFSADFR
jgi:hypothetical protein